MKGIFYNKSALLHLGVLLYFILIGLLINTLLGHLVFSISESEPENIYSFSFYEMHAIQFVSVIFLFIIPAIGTAYFCSKKPREYLHLYKIKSLKVIVLCILMTLFLSPVIDITAYLNSKMHLPEFMEPVENWMRYSEDKVAELTNMLLSEKGLTPFISNIIVIGVMAGVSEELLFRGALTSIIEKKIKNHHIVIWFVAIIFSAIHMQFFGFIPRMLLGAYLGYLLYWSGSIWVPIFAHFLNNTIAIIGYKMDLFQLSSDNFTFISEDMEAGELYTILALATIGLILFFLCVKIMKATRSSTADNNKENPPSANDKD